MARSRVRSDDRFRIIIPWLEIRGLDVDGRHLDDVDALYLGFLREIGGSRSAEVTVERGMAQGA